jgi:hypothetical protein
MPGIHKGHKHRPKPRGVKEIIADINALRFGSAIKKTPDTLAEFLAAQDEVLAPSGLDEYKVHPMLGEINALKDAWNAVLADPAAASQEPHRKALSKAHGVIQFFIEEEFDRVRGNLDVRNNLADAYVEKMGGEKFVDLRMQDTRESMACIDEFTAAQNLFVELCDHYKIPTKRQPPKPRSIG